MRDRYSVIIAGAGPTGLTLANLLGKAGISVLLVETKGATVSEPRAVSIDDESLRVVQAMGLLDIVERDLVHGYGSEYRSPAGRTFLTVKPLGQPYGHPRRNAFRQPILERQLREGLARWPSVEALFHCSVGDFTQDKDGVAVHLHGNDGERRIVHASYLIGCDGASSSIRQQLGYVLQGSTVPERWLIIDLENSPVESKETIVFCDPARPAIALPGPHLTRRFEFKLVGSETDADMLDPARVRHLLASHGTAPDSRIVRTTVYHFHARLADHWGRDRVWLAGDAAHLTPPFAGQGMNSGIRDAFNLAWKLAYVLQGRIGPGLLLSYEQERRGHVMEMIRLASRMGRIMGPETPLHGAFTRVAFRLLGLWPAARSYFAEMKYKPPPRFEDGFLVRSMLSVRGLVGRMIPQPRVPAGGEPGADGRLLLDELLGAGFALIGIDIPRDDLQAISLGTDWDGLIERRLTLLASEVPELAQHSGYVLLLRPDRYVAARFTCADVPAAAAQLGALLAATTMPAKSPAPMMSRRRTAA